MMKNEKKNEIKTEPITINKIMVVGTIFLKSSFFLKSQFIFTTFCPKLLITGSPRLMRISLLRFFKTFQKYLTYAFLSKLLPYCNFEAIFGQRVAVMKEISQKSLKQAKTLKKTTKQRKNNFKFFVVLLHGKEKSL